MSRADLIRAATAKVKAIGEEKRAEAEEQEIQDKAVDLAIRMQQHDSLIEAVEGNKPDLENMAQVMSDAVQKIEIKLPEIKLPKITSPKTEVTVDIPEIKIPPIIVPQAVVKIPQQKAPVVKVDAPIVKFPKFPTFMDVGLSLFTKKKPMPTISVDPTGKFINPVGGGGGGNASSLNKLLLKEAKDYALEASMGNLDGITSVNKFGRAPSGIQTTATDVWDRADATPTQSVWVAPLAARTHIIHSTSILDDAASTGAKTVQVYGLKAWDSNEVNEVVSMAGNASTAVTKNSYVIIHRMKVLTKGATAVNNGVITATATTDNSVTAQINEGEGQTQMAIYGVPSSQTAYMTSYYGTLNKSGGAVGTLNFSLVVNPEPDVELTNFLTKNTRGLQSTGNSGDSWNFNPYFKISGPAIIKVSATANTADLEASAGFDLLLVDNG